MRPAGAVAQTIHPQLLVAAEPDVVTLPADTVVAAGQRDVASDLLSIALCRSSLGTFDALTTSGVSQLLRLLAVGAGIKKRVHPHLLRHSFATWALTRGMNPLTLVQTLGHSSLVMIQNVYSHLTPADSYEALLKILADD